MSKNLESDKQLKAEAINFFSLSRAAVCNDPAQFNELFQKQRFKMQCGIVFDVSPEVSRAEYKLVARCVGLLGSKGGHEDEIRNLAWEHTCEGLDKLSDGSSAGAIAANFIKSLPALANRHFRYIAPNYVVQFKGQVRRISIGPVEAIISEDIVSELGHEFPALDFVVGQESLRSFLPYGPTMKVQLSAVSWRVSTKAAKGHLKEEAGWLIDIALSLLRLNFPSGQFLLFPPIGAAERRSQDRPEIQDQGIILADGNVSLGGTSLVHMYEVDSSVLAITETEQFKTQAKAIFSPANKTLGVRFGQGLGWLTRGRQSADRSERFLFFFTAIEALLSSNDKAAPVIQTIARYASVILQSDITERSKFASTIRALYGERSALVHAGARNISNIDANMVQYVAECLYKTVLEKTDLKCSFQSFQDSLAEASYGAVWVSPTTIS